MWGNSFNLSPDSLNDFFSTVAVSDEHQPATQYAPSCCNSSDSSFHFTPIYPQQIQLLLQHLNNQKSTDPNCLFCRFLGEVASEIAETLTSSIISCTTVVVSCTTVVVHNRDQAEIFQNTLIERTPKAAFRALDFISKTF